MVDAVSLTENGIDKTGSSIVRALLGRSTKDGSKNVIHVCRTR
jgi:hypothetical protein